MVTVEDIRRVALSLPGSVGSYPAVLVRLNRIDLDEMTELVTEAWRLCAPKRVLAAYDAEHPPAQRPA